jgi:hypothetical protein
MRRKLIVRTLTHKIYEASTKLKSIRIVHLSQCSSGAGGLVTAQLV